MRVSVTVKTNAKEEKVVELLGSSASKNTKDLVVYVKAVPVEGKANMAIAKVLAKHFKTSPSCVTLYRGEKSKQKIFDII